jgi:hypothetical protein
MVCGALSTTLGSGPELDSEAAKKRDLWQHFLKNCPLAYCLLVNGRGTKFPYLILELCCFRASQLRWQRPSQQLRLFPVPTRRRLATAEGRGPRIWAKGLRYEGGKEGCKSCTGCWRGSPTPTWSQRHQTLFPSSLTQSQNKLVLIY